MAGSSGSRVMARARLASSLLPLLAMRAAATCQGELAMGGVTKAYVTGDGVAISGGKMVVSHNSGISITASCVDGWDPNGFMHFPMLGRTLTYTADLSKVGCGCNLAVYLISEPALDVTGKPTTGTCSYSPYYCDANMVCGQWCPELDIMEANRMTLQATPHKCDVSGSPMFNSCDRSGLGRNTKEVANSFGVGAEHTIDTSLPFEVSTTFGGTNGSGAPGTATFTSMKTTMRQAGRELVLDNQAGAPYLQGMVDDMSKGMSIRVTYWGHDAGTMKWLDGSMCGEQVCGGADAGEAILSDFRIDPPYAGSPCSPGGSGPSIGEKLFYLLLVGGCCLLGYLAYTHRAYLLALLHHSLERYKAYSAEVDTQSGGVPNAYQPSNSGWFPQQMMEAQAPSLGPTGNWLADRSGWAAAQLARLPQLIGEVCARGAGLLNINSGVEGSAVSEGFQTANRKCYSLLRPPLQYGVEVEVAQDRSIPVENAQSPTAMSSLLSSFASAKVAQAKAKGKVVALGVDSQKTSFVQIQFDEGGFATLRGEQQLWVETEDQKTVKINSAKYVMMAGGGCLLVVLILLAALIVHWTRGGGPVAPAIPPGGCCGWKPGLCGETTEYCKEPTHCVQDCNGQWSTG
mmetsp:Transcript_89375/g.252218  ORF Transcript_89375/g.252218 Transcript_89375/m.252218 type:complete len:628 (+) Transcript_89375:32-1915(+)